MKPEVLSNLHRKS